MSIFLDVEIEILEQTAPLSVLEYSQADEALSLWVLTAQAPSISAEQNKEVSVHITFSPGADGRLEPKSLHVEGVDPSAAIKMAMGSALLETVATLGQRRGNPAAA